jgi:hypothetical protein
VSSGGVCSWHWDRRSTCPSHTSTPNARLSLPLVVDSTMVEYITPEGVNSLRRYRPARTAWSRRERSVDGESSPNLQSQWNLAPMALI